MKTLKYITESFKLNEETLDREDRMDIVEAMRILLGSAYSLQLKTQHYHWNIQGPDFVQYHTYLGELYEFISGHVDNIAEQIRALDSASIGTFEAFASVSEINLDESIPPALVMLNNVANDFGTMIEVLDDVNDIAEDVDAAGLANYLQDTIDQFNKKHWMLKAIQQRSLTESVNEGVQESLRKDIASLASQFPKGTKVKVKNARKYDALQKDGVKGEVLGNGKDFIMVAVGKGQMNVHPKDLVKESLDEATMYLVKMRDGTKHKKTMDSTAAEKMKKNPKVLSVSVIGNVAEDAEYVNEKLKVSDGMGTWIKDFQASDAPQFKGKSDKERRDMAIAAFMSAKRNESTNESDISQQTADDNKKKMIRKAEKDKLVRLNTMLDREKQRQKARKAQLSK